MQVSSFIDPVVMPPARATGARTQPAPVSSPSVAINDPVVEPQPSEPPDRAHGVLRNLAAGHFRGMADIRLRTNFADEIKAAGLELPPVTPPKGRGKPHDALLAAYQSRATPAAEHPPLDQVA